MTQDLADRLEKARNDISDARKAGAHWELIGDLRINLDRALFNNLDTILASLRRSAPASGEMGEAIELPDDLRVPLHSLQADTKYLFGRVAADGSVAGVMAEAVLSLLTELEGAIMSNMRALSEKHTSLAIRADQYRNERDAALASLRAVAPAPSETVGRGEDERKLVEDFRALMKRCEWDAPGSYDSKCNYINYFWNMTNSAVLLKMLERL